MRRSALVVLLGLPAVLAADDVYLTNGGRLSGLVVSRGDTQLTLDVGAGRITLPLSRVARIVTASSPLATYRQRARTLEAKDVNGWLELALWARDQELLTQAREAFAHILTLDPANATAHQALGDVQVGERWMSLEESYRAKGLVRFEGEWVTPEAQAALIRARSDEAAAARSRAEAEARVREAEARARAAEADARRAEAAAEPAGMGVPFVPFGFGVGLCHGAVCATPPPPPPSPTPPPPQSTPAPRSSWTKHR